MNKKKSSGKKSNKVAELINHVAKALSGQAVMSQKVEDALIMGKKFQDQLISQKIDIDTLRYSIMGRTLPDRPIPKHVMSHEETRDLIGQSNESGFVNKAPVYGIDWGSKPSESFVTVREGGANYGKTYAQMKAIHETMNPKSEHQETLDKVESLAVDKGRAQVVHEDYQAEIKSLQNQRLELQREIATLKTIVTNRDFDIKRHLERIDNLMVIVKKTDALIAYLEPKAKSKHYHTRRVDSRNVLKRLARGK